MQLLLLVTCMLGEPPAANEKGTGSLESVRAEYLADAEKYQFYADTAHKEPLELVAKPVMRWTSLKDYSGDVFVWTHRAVPAVVGCMLSGPSGERTRNLTHEFHLVSDEPIAPVDLASRRRWQPAEGLKRQVIEGAPAPATSPTGRLTQMRQISREFMVQMEAVNGTWELRLLPQPLLRYGDEKSDVIDGALLAHVWTTGTDPEFILLLECRKTDKGNVWHFAPVQFTNRALRLAYGGREVWHIEPHQEPNGQTTLLYTTAFVRTFTPATAATTAPQPKLDR